MKRWQKKSKNHSKSSGSYIYNVLIEAIGAFLLAINTGINVPINAITILPATIIEALITLKSKSLIPNPSDSSLLIKKQITKEAIIEITKHITAIIPLSEKKILNKSDPLVPIALKILLKPAQMPISGLSNSIIFFAISIS